MNIVSLLPSATEIICSLGLREQLVGVTHECDYPASVAGLPKVTRTLIPHDASSLEIDRLVRKRLDSVQALYSLDMDVLEKLKPDFIVTQALCDVCAVAEQEVLMAANTLPGNPQVINLEPMTLDDVFITIDMVAQQTGVTEVAKDVLARLYSRVETVRQNTNKLLNKTDYPQVVFLEWLDPPFNGGHWNPELVELAGGIDLLGNKHAPATSISWQDILEAKPQIMFIACCGYPLQRTLEDIDILKRRQGWDDLPCVQDKRVYVTDGNAYFSRPGPRLVDSLEIIANALHPDIHQLAGDIPRALNICELNSFQ